MIKAIFWDSDGTLVDTEELYYLATREVFATVNETLTAEDFTCVSLCEGRSVFSILSPDRFTTDDLSRLRQQRDARYTELLKAGISVKTGVLYALRHLHGRITMAIVSSARKEHFDIIHEKSGLLGYFDFYLTREDYVHSKPNPEPYLLALSRCQLDAKECVVVEDTKRGLESAAAAGLRCIVIPGQLTTNGEFDDAYRILVHAGDVVQAVDGDCA